MSDLILLQQRALNVLTHVTRSVLAILSGFEASFFVMGPSCRVLDTNCQSKREVTGFYRAQLHSLSKGDPRFHLPTDI
ncbi:hypothetical protein HNQ08_005080 [Deinococcus humi]|uniref:Uncharacterized protein n=1 Tax=Deinococcus humi TaxID=662880 RepID=A0A7W8NFY6_9DEIO|nr:hypothetical protein [Deinococcus humi]GGO41790.1 hypothetical protein GCM10008949_53050 [Deinococcus humi]